MSGEVKKTQRNLAQLLLSTLLPCLTGKPFNGFNVITVTSGFTITVSLSEQSDDYIDKIEFISDSCVQ